MIEPLTDDEKAALRNFLNDRIAAWKSHPYSRQDMKGVQSGLLFKTLKLPAYHPAIASKLKDRSGLIAAACDLDFVVYVGQGGSRRGTVRWQSIDLPDE